MADKFTNGLYTITNIEYDINDYAIVEDYGEAPIIYDLDNIYVLINDVEYSLDEFIRV